MATKEEIQLIIKSEVDKATADLKKFNKELIITGKNTSKTEKETKGFSDSVGNVGKVIKGVAFAGVASSIFAMGKAAVSAAADMEKQQVAFEVMLGSAEKAKDLLEEIKAFSASTPFQLPGLVDNAKKLIAFGVSSEDVIQKMRNIGNAAMGNAESMNRLADAYGKTRAKGKASMEELNRFMEAGVPILDELSKMYGKTGNEVVKMVSLGKVGFNDIDSALTNLTTGTGQFAGMLEKQSGTLSGLMSTVQDNIGLAAMEIGNEMLPFLKEMSQALLDNKEGFMAMASGIGKSIVFMKDLITYLPGVQAGMQALAMANKEKAKNQTKSMNEIMSGINKEINAVVKAGQATNYHTSAIKAKNKAAKEVTMTYEEYIKKQMEGFNKQKGFEKEIADYKKQTQQSALIDEEVKFQNLLAMQDFHNISKEELELVHQERIAEIKEQFRQQELQKTLNSVNNTISGFKNIASQGAAIFSQYYRNKSLQMDADYRKEKDKIIKNIADEDEREKALEKLDERYEKKRAEMAYKQAKGEKKIAIMGATINTAQAITKALSQGGFFGGPIMAGVVGALGAAQIALIAKQPIPKAEAGALIQGSSSGTTLTAGERNKTEAIIPLEDERAQESLSGIMGGNTINLYVDVLNGDSSEAKKFAGLIDTELTKLRQDGNSSFANVIEGR